MNTIGQGISQLWYKYVKITWKNVHIYHILPQSEKGIWQVPSHCCNYSLYIIWKESVKALWTMIKRYKIKQKTSKIAIIWNRVKICFTCINLLWYVYLISVPSLKKIGPGIFEKSLQTEGQTHAGCTHMDRHGSKILFWAVFDNHSWGALD